MGPLWVRARVVSSENAMALQTGRLREKPMVCLMHNGLDIETLTHLGMRMVLLMGNSMKRPNLYLVHSLEQ